MPGTVTRMGWVDNPLKTHGNDDGLAESQLQRASDHASRLRLKLLDLRHNFEVSQEQTLQLIQDVEVKRNMIDALAQKVQTEKLAALEMSKFKSGAQNKHTETSKYYEHHSPNIMRTLIEGIERSHAKLVPGEAIDWVWGLVFSLPKQDMEPGEKRFLEQRAISHELWAMVEQMWQCDLHVDYTITADNSNLILTVGATHETLVKEAHDAGIPMRAANTRGSLRFHADLTKYFARNHGGLNEWDAEGAKWHLRAGQSEQSRVILKDMDGDGDVDEHDLSAMRTSTLSREDIRMKDMVTREVASLSDAEVVEELQYRGCKTEYMQDPTLMRHRILELRDRDLRMMDSEREHRIFTSAIRQRLVRRRITKMCGIDMDERIDHPSAKAALAWIEEHAVLGRTKIRSKKVIQMLVATGGYRPEGNKVFRHPDTGTSAVAKLAQQCMVDPQFVIVPHVEPKSSKKLQANNLEAVTYEELKEVHRILKLWIHPDSGPGKNEVFVDTFKSYFPLHDHKELQYLKDQWGTLTLLTERTLSGYREDWNPVSFSHDENIPHEHTIPWSWTWQPLHEIRDYFGEDVGLYQAWLGHYTSMLFLCMIFGCIVMAVQPYFGGVDKNPFTLAYSVYVGMWSVSFIEGWKRKECEYRFLWGSEHVSDEEGMRSKFRGELSVTETGRERIVYKSIWKRYGRLSASAFVCLVCILITIGSALAASTVRYYDRPGSATFCSSHSDQCCSGMIIAAKPVKGCSIDDCVVITNHTCCTGCSYTVLIDDVPTDGPYGPLNEKGVPIGMDLVTDGPDNGQCDPDIKLSVTSALGWWSDLKHHPCGIWEQKKWQFLSSALNLVIIQSFGMIYELITALLNDYENHRTEAEAENSLVIKNFIFQFLNNYFMLFYIAFLRDWLQASSDRIIASSTLPELQEQMLIVFTGKTIGKQFAHSAKPFVIKWLNKAYAFYLNKKFQQEELQRKRDDPDYVMTSREDTLQTMVVTSEHEKQSLLMPYDGTFDDFNDRVIQFGYIVLFAPAYPLAPFLAFLNNIIEVRTAVCGHCIIGAAFSVLVPSSMLLLADLLTHLVADSAGWLQDVQRLPTAKVAGTGFDRLVAAYAWRPRLCCRSDECCYGGVCGLRNDLGPRNLRVRQRYTVQRVV